MGRRIVGIALAAAASLAGGAQAQERGWTRLFDGRSLAGWTAKIAGHPAGENWRDTFVAADGAIRVSYAKYDRFENRFGHLFYRAPFSAYRLRLNYRVLDPSLPDTPAWARGNSGVMFHSQSPESMGLGQPFPVSVEFQILGADGPGPRPTGSVCTPGVLISIAGAPQKEHCITSSGPTIPNGTWTELELEVRADGEVTEKINGKAVHRYKVLALDPADPLAPGPAKALIAERGGDASLKGGYIALQSEGHPIEFKDIRILELR